MTFFKANLNFFRKQQKTLQTIDAYQFPTYLKEKVEACLGKSLTPQEYEKIEKALRQFFKAWVLSSYKSVAMPSQAADALWHELILNTQEYAAFCQNVLGKFLHHTTNEAKTQFSPKKEKQEVLNTWRLCCQTQHRDSLDIYSNKDLVDLFEVDKSLGLYNRGFIWFTTNIEKELFLLKNPHLIGQIKNINLIENLFF